MNYKDLSWLQIDILKEVINITVGNAVSSLSDIFGDEIKMTVPSVEVIPLNDIFKKIGNPEDQVYAIFTQFDGDINGNTFFLLHENMIKHFDKNDTSSLNKEMIVTQIGSIISRAFFDSLVEFSHLNILYSPFQLAYDMLGAIVQQGFLEYCELFDQIIFIKNTFILNDENMEGHFIFFPNPVHLNVLFSKLGVPYDEN